MKKLLMTSGGMLFLFFLSFSDSSSTISFQKTDYPIGNRPEFGTVGDFDKDGDLDLAVGKWFDENFSILFNDGQGDFSSIVNYPDSSGCLNILAVDIDKDTDLDIITSHWYNSLGMVDSTLSLFYNQGGGTFSGPTLIQTGKAPLALTSLDLENDGDIDLVTANYEGEDITILKNLGSEAFDTPLHMVPGSLPTDVASADFDNDGFADLVVTYRGDNTVSILLNQGNGTFAPKVDYVSNTGPRFAGIFDLDQDGDLDLGVPDFDASQISVYKNQGNGTFDTAVYYPTGYRPNSVVFPDLDKDGDPDLAVSSFYDNYFTYLEDIGNGQFAFGFDQFSGNGPISALSGDWNQDGWVDLAVTNTYSHNISVFLTIPAIYGVRVLAGSDEFGYKGGTVNVEFNLKNTGQVIDSFQVTVSDSLGWTISPPLSPVQLMPAQEVLVSVGVHIPTTALEGTKNKITLSGASLSSPASQSASLYVTALELCGDVNNDGKLNLADIIYYVNFMFKDGPAPCNLLGIR